jgi:uncharacterized protein YhfF
MRPRDDKGSWQPAIEAFWRAYVDALPMPEDTAARFYEVFRIGRSDADADAGAALILHGVKTAAGGLLWKYEAAQRPLPPVGSFNL